LTPDGIARGLRALAIMAGVARSHQPATITVVGTEALRRAPNSDEFVRAAHELTGLHIRVLSGYEEAYCGFLGVVNSTTLRDGYLLDIGGGSMEVMRVDSRRLAQAQSAPLGAIYSSERYLRSDPATPREVRALRKAVRAQIQVEGPHPVLFGTGGAVRNLARIVRLQRRYPLRRLHGLEISRREMRRLATRLASASSEERKRMPGVGANRADILHASAIVIDEVMQMLEAESITVAGQGLREGLAWQELRDESPILPDVRAASVSGLARANGVDELSAEPTVHAAATIFEATSDVHRLGPAELDLLLHAARLARIGMHIDYYNRDRHAEYLVHSGDLHGFSHREIIILAALVRWADSGTPDLSLYKPLVQAEDARTAASLAVILGLARAVRRRIPSPVLDLRARVKKSELQLTLTAHADISAELYELERQQRRLESVLKLSLSVNAAARAGS
jgi:exopolyphosphatase/guanosine-5'-triphosphate,3'-diphosphate pyrophosphatase